MNKRQLALHVRVTFDEYEKVTQAAEDADLSFSNYIRKSLELPLNDEGRSKSIIMAKRVRSLAQLRLTEREISRRLGCSRFLVRKLKKLPDLHSV